MYRLLIVDDEVLIADGLCSMFQNEPSLDLDVFKCYSAYDALALLDQTRIDIVLSDIKMPGMNGLELLSQINNKWPHCRVIFITGHEEFEYAYQVIKYKNVRYILKTEGSKKVIQEVKDVTEEIQNNMINRFIETPSMQSDYSPKLIQKDCMLGILFGLIPPQEITCELFQRLEIPLEMEETTWMLLIEINSQPGQYNFSRRFSLYYQIQEIIHDYLSNRMEISCTPVDERLIIAFLQPKDSIKDEAKDRWISYIKDNLELIQEVGQKALQVTLTFILNSPISNMRSVSQNFFKLRRLLMENSHLGGEVILLDEKKEIQLSKQEVYTYPSKEITRTTNLMQTYLEQGSMETFYVLMDEFMGDFTIDQSMNNNYLIEKYLLIVTMLLGYINKKDISQQLAFSISLYKLPRMNYHENWEEARSYIRTLVEKIVTIIDIEKVEVVSETIEQIEKYINNNLNGELSLITIADKTNFNPSYLSRLFKQVTNKNLSEYICDKKIEKAKYLLCETDQKIQEISDVLGYSSSSNFIRFFKKNTFLTPQEYRDEALISE